MTDSPDPLVSPTGNQPPKSWWARVGRVIRDAFALFGAFEMLTAFGVTFEFATEIAVLLAVTLAVIAVVSIARHRRQRTH